MKDFMKMAALVAGIAGLASCAASPALAKDANLWKHAVGGWTVSKVVKKSVRETFPDIPEQTVQNIGCGAAVGVGVGMEVVQHVFKIGYGDPIDAVITGGAGCAGVFGEDAEKAFDIAGGTYGAVATVGGMGAVGAVTVPVGGLVAYALYIKAYHPEQIAHVDSFTLPEEDRFGK